MHVPVFIWLYTMVTVVSIKVRDVSKGGQRSQLAHPPESYQGSQKNDVL